jgi:hypothetical protein
VSPLTGCREVDGNHGPDEAHSSCASVFNLAAPLAQAGKLVEHAPEGRRSGQDEPERPGHLRPWLGDEHILRSHRSALLRKNREWYRPRFRDVPDDLPYWPDARFDTRPTG